MMLLPYIIIISLATIGVYVATKEGMILDFLPRVLRNAPSFVQKPLYGCPMCMASVWGGLFSLFCPIALVQLPLVVCAVCGLNWLIMLLITDKIPHEWL